MAKSPEELSQAHVVFCNVMIDVRHALKNPNLSDDSRIAIAAEIAARIAADVNMIDRLEAAVRAAVTRAQSGKPVSPSDFSSPS